MARPPIAEAQAVEAIRSLLQPRAIAVIGASSVPNSFGERATRHFHRLGYAGQVHFVNPRYAEVAGQVCHACVSAIPGAVDAALVLVNARGAAAAIQEVAAKGCRAAVVLGSGFGEAGAAGQALQDELLRTARRHGVRLVGPNTNGLVNVADGVPLGFSSVAERQRMRPGPLAVLAQSGSVAASFADAAMENGTGVSYVLGIGNAIDLDVSDFLGFLAQDARTRVAFAFLEGIREPQRFLAAVEHFRRCGKTLVLQKVGRSAHGRALAATHSGSIAGSWEAFQALAQDRGALVAQSLDEALELCAAATVCWPQGHSPRLAVVTMSGALAGVYADEAMQAGLEVTDLCEAAGRSALESMGFRAPFNPLDFGGAVGSASEKPDFRRVCELLLASPQHDGLLVVTGLTHNLKNMATALVELAPRSAKPIAVHALGGAVVAPFNAALREAGIPVIVRLGTALAAWGRATALPPPRPQSAALPAPTSEQRSGLRAAAESPDEDTLATLLESYGVRYPARALATTAGQAADAAATLGYPVALKVVGPRVLHKTVAGLLRLPLSNADQVQRAFNACEAAALAQGVWAGHAMVQSLVDLRGGIEFIVALRQDVEVGPVMLLGIGGAVAEAVAAVAIGSLPAATADVERLIASHPALRKLLNEEQRGLDRDRFIEALVALGAAGRDALGTFETIEVNPLVLLPAGRGCWGLDAIATPSGSAA